MATSHKNKNLERPSSLGPFGPQILTHQVVDRVLNLIVYELNEREKVEQHLIK